MQKPTEKTRGFPPWVPCTVASFPGPIFEMGLQTIKAKLPELRRLPETLQIQFSQRTYYRTWQTKICCHCIRLDNCYITYWCLVKKPELNLHRTYWPSFVWLVQRRLIFRAPENKAIFRGTCVYVTWTQVLPACGKRKCIREWGKYMHPAIYKITIGDQVYS